jgi:hypothetical protein
VIAGKAMGQFLLKTLVSALLIAAASELARRSTLFAALIISLPLTSLLALAWLWRDTHDVQRVAALSNDILWLVLPSLLLFIALPLLLRLGFGFWAALGLAMLVTSVGYAAMIALRSALT